MAVESYALTTVSRLQDFLGISSLTATETTVMESIINQTSSFIQNYTGKTFKLTAYSNELLNGYGTNQLVLKNNPVDSSASFTLEYRNSDLNENEWTTFDSDAYFVDWDSGVIYKGGKGIFRRGHKLFRANYTAGYDFDLVTTFPSDFQDIAKIEMVCQQIASMLWARRKDDPAVKGERLGDYSVTYSGSVFHGLLFNTGGGTGGSSMIQVILDEFRDGGEMITTVVSPHPQVTLNGN